MEMLVFVVLFSALVLFVFGMIRVRATKKRRRESELQKAIVRDLQILEAEEIRKPHEVNVELPKPDQQKRRTKKLRLIIDDDDFIHTKSMDFACVGVRSPDGRYLTGCGQGWVVLVQDSEVVYTVCLEDPSYPAVSNNGLVTLNDQGKENFSGCFYVLDIKGAPIIRHHVSANIERCDISENGDFAWFTSCGSADPNDSGSLFIYSPVSKELLLTIDERKVPSSLAIIDDEIHVCIDGFMRRYDRGGNMLNSGELRKAKRAFAFNDGDVDLFLNLCEAVILSKKEEPFAHGESLVVFKRAQTFLNDSAVHIKSKARIFRLLGAIAESAGHIDSALDCYKRALYFNPNIGLKRTVSKLEKFKPR